jgi:hypothetical protein
MSRPASHSCLEALQAPEKLSIWAEDWRISVRPISPFGFGKDTAFIGLDKGTFSSESPPSGG